MMVARTVSGEGVRASVVGIERLAGVVVCLGNSTASPLKRWATHSGEDLVDQSEERVGGVESDEAVGEIFAESLDLGCVAEAGDGGGARGGVERAGDSVVGVGRWLLMMEGVVEHGNELVESFGVVGHGGWLRDWYCGFVARKGRRYRDGVCAAEQRESVGFMGVWWCWLFDGLEEVVQVALEVVVEGHGLDGESAEVGGDIADGGDVVAGGGHAGSFDVCVGEDAVEGVVELLHVCGGLLRVGVVGADAVDEGVDDGGAFVAVGGVEFVVVFVEGGFDFGGEAVEGGGGGEFDACVVGAGSGEEQGSGEDGDEGGGYRTVIGLVP